MDQHPSVTSVANRIQDVARKVQREHFMTTELDQKLEQAKRLGELAIEAGLIVDDTVELLYLPPDKLNRLGRWVAQLFHRRRFTGIDRINLGIHLVNAALLHLWIDLLIIRADANWSWLERSANASDYRREVRLKIGRFKRTLRRAPISFSALNFLTITSAIRSWADELSIPATEISGWLEAAIPVSRDLRYLANYYHTLWLWRSVIDPHTIGGLGSRTIIFIKAIFDSAFGTLSGYGLKGRRFIASLLLIVLLFSVVFDAIDVFAGCKAWWSVSGAWTYVVLSASYLVGNGPPIPNMQADAACAGTGYSVGEIGIVETGMGYLMLGMFVSLLWSVIQRRSIDTSRLIIPGLLQQAPQPTQVQVGINQEETVVSIVNNESLVSENEQPVQPT